MPPRMTTVDPATEPFLSGRFAPSTTRSTPTTRRRRHAAHRPRRRLPAQRPEPRVHAARLVHVPARGRRDDPRRVVRGRPGPLRQPLRAHPEPAGRGARRAGPVRRAHDAGVRRHVAARRRPRPGLAVQARRVHQRRPPRRPLPRPRGGHAPYEIERRRSTPIGRYDFGGGLPGRHVRPPEDRPGDGRDGRVPLRRRGAVPDVGDDRRRRHGHPAGRRRRRHRRRAS